MTSNNRQLAAHLLRRAGFGGSPDEITQYAALDYEAAVDRLLVPATVDDSAAEDTISALTGQLDFSGRANADAPALWLARMMITQRPLQEKMTLFWHNHFATGIGKVKSAPLMIDQAALFRRAGLGNFADLLAGVAQDPAMILWLDGQTNVKRHPNENWGRELMELFTIGIGNYSEQDVKEVARAFTGWGLTAGARGAAQTAQLPTFEFHARQHDTGAKTIFGRTGNWDGGDVIGMLVPRIETGKLLARKMWRWFVNGTPDEAGVADLAGVYLSSQYDIGAMLRHLFLSAAFQDEANAFNTIKNPAEFIVGLFKTLGMATPTALRSATAVQSLRTLARACSSMGMTLYNPPDVGGWPGGATWMNPSTYFVRTNLAATLLQQGAGLNLGALTGNATRPDALVDTLLDTFVGSSEPDAVRQDLLTYLGGSHDDLKVRGLVRLIISSPSYQMN